MTGVQTCALPIYPESTYGPMSKDPSLKETGQILADLVSLMSHQRVADKGA